MSKLYFFGNCVINSIAWYFRNHAPSHDQYEVLAIESWKSSESDVKHFFNDLRSDDRIIMQPHSTRLSYSHSTEFIRSLLPCTSITSVASLFLPIYNPFEYNSAIVSSANISDPEMLYADALLLYYIIAKKMAKENRDMTYSAFVNTLPSEFWLKSLSYSLGFFDKLQTLERERSCNVCLYDYILSYYQTNRLMLTINHPSSDFCFSIANLLASYSGCSLERPPVLSFFGDYASLIYEPYAKIAEFDLQHSSINDINYRSDKVYHLLSDYVDSQQLYTSQLLTELEQHLGSMDVLRFLV